MPVASVLPANRNHPSAHSIPHFPPGLKASFSYLNSMSILTWIRNYGNPKRKTAFFFHFTSINSKKCLLLEILSAKITVLWVCKDYFRLLGGAMMAKCAICEKGAHFGNNVSHSHRKTPKMWKSNVKSVRVKTEGGSKKMYVCTSCLKSGRVERA